MNPQIIVLFDDGEQVFARSYTYKGAQTIGRAYNEARDAGRLLRMDLYHDDGERINLVQEKMSSLESDMQRLWQWFRGSPSLGRMEISLLLLEERIGTHEEFEKMALEMINAASD